MEYKDLSVNGFTFRFIKEDNEWVCKMPTWLLEAAQDTINALNHREEQALQQLLDEDKE